MLTLIDNFDSYTYNLVHAFETLGQTVEVVRYDQIGHISGNFLFIGPGPGSPESVPACVKLLRTTQLPTLGICLGHQCLAAAFGGQVVRAHYPMHGKTSVVHHCRKGLFSGIDAPIEVGRYHSLIASRQTLPDELEVTAWTESGEIMALQHVQRPIFGLQFHPESILTPLGHLLLKNFLTIEESYDKKPTLPAHTAL